ncbi:MAG: hypothetical protein WEE64_08315 [Dehalococcoidia bacterium]
MTRSPLSVNAVLLVAALLAFVAVAVSCGGGSAPTLDEVALNDGDVPGDWAPSDFDQERGQALWDVLPELLSANSEARLLLRAYEDDTGNEGAAVIVIEAEAAGAIPQEIAGQRVVEPLTQLLLQQEALLGPEVLGGDPGTYFALSDDPVPGSLRSRLARLIEDDRLFSDSLVFPSGRLMVVVTVWYPEQQGPFREVEDLAADVERRLGEYSREAQASHDPS